eukprot:3530239-Pyramimonas_sp.AAC.1
MAGPDDQGTRRDPRRAHHALPGGAGHLEPRVTRQSDHRPLRAGQGRQIGPGRPTTIQMVQFTLPRWQPVYSSARRRPLVGNMPGCSVTAQLRGRACVGRADHYILRRGYKASRRLLEDSGTMGKRARE